MIFGPGDPVCIGGMIQQMKAGKTRYMIGDGSTLVDPTYIDNVCWGHILAADALTKNPDVGGSAYNITNDQPVRFWSFISTLCGSLGYERPMYRIPYFLLSFIIRVFSIFGLQLIMPQRRLELVALDHTYSCERARTVLGYEPLVRVQEGLTNVIEFAKLHDSEVLRKSNDAKAKSKHYKKHVAEGGTAVITDIRAALALWTAFYLAVFLGVGAAAQAARLLVVYIGCTLAGISTEIDSVVWSYGTNVLVPLTLVLSSTSVVSWSLVSVVGLIVSIGIYIYATRGTVIPAESRAPIVGNLLRLRQGPTALCARLSREFFECYSLSLFGKPVVFFTGQQGYEFFFKATDEEVSLKEVYKISHALFGEKVIYDVGLEERQQQFHYLAQGLSENHLRSYVPLMIDECEKYFKSWGESGICEDIYHTVSELIAFTSCRCLLGDEIRAMFESDVKQLLMTLDDGVTPIGMVFPYFPLPAHWARDRAREKLHSIFSTVIASRRSRGDTCKNQDSMDTLGLLIAAKGKDGKACFTDKQMCGMLSALFFGGQHTSSATSAWLVINILSRAARETVDAIIGEQEEMDKNGGISFENVSTRCDVLNTCIIESLRLSNPLALVLRYCTRSRYFNGHEFAPGTIFAVAMNEAGTNPDIFEEPCEFRPQRWIENDWDDWRQQYKYLGFGSGRHTCMGRRFALLQIKTILSYVLHNFAIMRVSDDIPARNEKAMVVGPDRKYPVRYERVKGDFAVLKSKWTYI
eukprot:GHVQ01012614.1.p1 GENE.GHVQ01012614.1~~GHVQ01012614.1.p1  ORF type:complete len:749 (+),score=70.91 GHVQ01012614.1:216-2462(+)